MCDKAQKQHWVEFVLLPVECSIYRIHCIQPRCVIRFEHLFFLLLHQTLQNQQRFLLRFLQHRQLYVQRPKAQLLLTVLRSATSSHGLTRKKPYLRQIHR